MQENITPRPRFEPTPCENPVSPPTLDDAWVALVSAPADFPADLFEAAATQLIEHPEYNSTLILRSDLLATHTDRDSIPPTVPWPPGLTPIRTVHRKLLARRPGRDASLEQYCTLYADSPESTASALVLTPLPLPGAPLPYYHPAVAHLVLRLLPTGFLRIEALPLPDTPTGPASRLYRTCLALLDALHRYGWGAHTNYRKRAAHDRLVPRDTYQDLYLVMRERHGGMVQSWVEPTDPLKHVFEDIGIATYLMLLWKDTFSTSSTGDPPGAGGSEPWRTWPRPPGGFVDLGCGNGLLTHILIAEGYTGHGFDLHELTPWLPVLTHTHSAAGYLSIPCCAWSFDVRFQRGQEHQHQQESAYTAYRTWLAQLSAFCGWEPEGDMLRIPSTRNWAIVGRRRTGGNEAEWEDNVQRILEDVRARGVFKTRTPEGKAREH
ncbi:hypothetical protein BD779DRAFT_1545118 [Infundibulicybe gibba]|nr:hypothetical protein BD779DRAFT_1545118 [Infundibulicybe gibba]